MQYWQVSLITPLIGLLHYWFVVRPQLNEILAELNELTGDEQLSKKLIKRASIKYWYKGQVHCYEVALNSYQHHVTQKQATERDDFYTASPELLSQLDTLTGSQEDTDAVIQHLVNQNPQYPVNWLIEQVIAGWDENPAFVQRDEDSPSPPIKRLNALTHSQEVSDRLVRNLAERYPERPVNWLIEKAIADLERDRLR